MTTNRSSADWTERYLAAALKGIPEAKRGDVERELRSSIADAVEERVGAGESREAAERAVLEGLGDPSQLAANYTGKPNYLIGPELFPLYRHFLPRLIAAAVPIAAIVMGVVKVAGGGSFSDGIGAGISGAINVAIQIAFWGTVTFIFLERADSAREARDEIIAKGGKWTLERLPSPAPGRVTIGETIGEVFTVLITIGGLLFAQSIADTDALGARITLLDPQLTTFWLPVLIGVLGVIAALQVIVFYVGRWTIPLAVGFTALQLAFAAPIVWLALSGTLVNPAFAAHVGWPEMAQGDGWVMLVIAVSSSLVTAWEIFSVVRRASGRPRRPSG